MLLIICKAGVTQDTHHPLFLQKPGMNTASSVMDSSLPKSMEQQAMILLKGGRA